MDKSWIKQAAKSAWNEVFQKVKHSIVFMDNQCAECLFWIGGPGEMFKAGAVDIKDFSSFECGSDKHRKAVFVISTALLDNTMSIIKDIVTASKFDYCVVFTAVDIDTHCISRGINNENGKLMFVQCEDQICEWMGNMNYSSEVFYAPIFMACYTQFLFLTPCLNQFFPLQSHDIPALDSMRRAKGEKHPIQRISDVHFYSLPISYQTQIRQLVNYLNQLFETLSVKEELFAVGSTSRLIATQLANLPAGRQRRKVAATTASLVLVDRSLDVTASSCHLESSLADKIVGILPELPGHCNNVSVDMLKLTTAKTLLSDDLGPEEVDSISRVASCPGCLCPPDDACPQLLKDIITLPQKEAVVLIKRSLVEACIEEGIDIQNENNDSENKHEAHEISDLVESFYGNAGAIMYHNNMLQLSMAAAQTLSNSFHEKWMKFSAVEKLLFIEENPIAKIVQLSNDCTELKTFTLSTHCKLLRTDEEESKRWTAEDILELLVYACATKDVSDTNDETWDELSSSLSLMISDSSLEELPESLCEILGLQEGDDQEAELDVIQDVVEQTIKKLKGLTSCRQHLHHFQSLLTTSLGPPVYKSLLTRFVKRVLDPSKPDLQPDVEYVSTGLMDLLKSGFSMFKKVSQPRPNDGKLMFIFVVGGISFQEASAVEQIVRNYNSRQESNLRVVIGSTKITFPSDAVDKILFANNLSPSISR